MTDAAATDTGGDGVLERLSIRPAGFGNCGSCAYRDSFSVPICYACARKTLAPLADARCEVCDLPLSIDSEECNNPVCKQPNRNFTWSRAISMRAGTLKTAISRYKYQDRRGWGIIFGRVLAGFLDDHRDELARFDMILPSPTYVGPGGRAFDHTAEVLTEASLLDERGLPFRIDPPVIRRTRPSRKLVDCPSWAERRRVCNTEIAPHLSIPDHTVVEGRRILLYDDVFTDGLLLRTVATALVRAGAAEVCQVTLAHQPWHA